MICLCLSRRMELVTEPPREIKQYKLQYVCCDGETECKEGKLIVDIYSVLVGWCPRMFEINVLSGKYVCLEVSAVIRDGGCCRLPYVQDCVCVYTVYKTVRTDCMYEIVCTDFIYTKLCLYRLFVWSCFYIFCMKLFLYRLYVLNCVYIDYSYETISI